MDIAICEAEPADADELTQVLRETFVLACPPKADSAEMAHYLKDNLGSKSFLRLIG